MTDTLTKIARLHDMGYGFPTINGKRVEGAKPRLYCVHCEVDYPCATMALMPKGGSVQVSDDHPEYTNDAGELMRWCEPCGEYIYGEPCDDRVSGIDDL